MRAECAASGLHFYSSALFSFPVLPFILISLSIYFVLHVFFYKQFQIPFGSKCSVSTVIARMRRKEREINS